jgi:uncharacterized membrane protein YhaH (DUF805 family)
MERSVESILGLAPEDGKSPERDAAQAATVEESIWSFKGRIGRGSFWARWVMLMLGSFVGGLILGAMALAGGRSFAPLVVVLELALLTLVVWLSLAMQVKRWHDLDRSGLMVLWNFTFIALPIVLIILGFVRGTGGPNRYGSDPLKQAGAIPSLASALETRCDRCGDSFPSNSYLEKSQDNRYLCEKCRPPAPII